jgi:predicted alpha/beta hydrolase
VEPSTADVDASDDTWSREASHDAFADEHGDADVTSRLDEPPTTDPPPAPVDETL